MTQFHPEKHSLHDHKLVAYAVNCSERSVTLRTTPPEGADSGAAMESIVIFRSVYGYSLFDDAFDNIIFDLRAVPVRELLARSIRGDHLYSAV